MAANDRVRVAVLGKSRSILSWFEDLQGGFIEAGAEVMGVSIQPQQADERILQKVDGLRELDNPKVLARIARQLLAFKPDLIVVQNKVGLPLRAVEAWESAIGGARVVGWLCDHLGGVPPALESTFAQVYYFDSDCLPAIEKFYEKNAVLSFLPLAVNPLRYPFRKVRSRKPSLVFAGKCSDHRKQVFAQLRARGVPLEWFGPGSEQWLKPWRSRRISANRLAKIYREYVGCLNVPQPGNTEAGLNLRAFEVPCCGGVGLYPWVEDLERCFEPGREILAYTDIDELCEIVERLLHSPELSERIAAKGRARILAEHTFTHRAATILADHRKATS